MIQPELVTPVRAPWETGNLILHPERVRLRRNSIRSQRITDHALSRERISIPGVEAWARIKAHRARLRRDDRAAIEAIGIRYGADVRFDADVNSNTEDTTLPFTTGGLADFDGDKGVQTNRANGRVSLWSEQFGNGYSVAQSTAANQPGRTLENANGRGHGSVDGDGSAFWLGETSGIATALDGDDVPFYYIGAVKPNDVATLQATWSVDKSTHATNNRIRFSIASTTEWRIIRRGNSTPTATETSGTPTTNAAIVEVEFVATSSGETSMWHDGTAITTDAALNAVALSGADLFTMFATRNAGTASSFADVDKFRDSFFSTVPSDANKDILNAFMGDLYGVTIS